MIYRHQWEICEFDAFACKTTMSQLLIDTTLISLALLVTEKTLLLGRLAKQGRPIVFAAFILIIRTACKARPSYCFCSFSYSFYYYSYYSSYSSPLFSALSRLRAFIQKPYDRVMYLVGGKHFLISRNVLTFGPYGKTCFLARHIF